MRDPAQPGQTTERTADAPLNKALSKKLLPTIATQRITWTWVLMGSLFILMTVFYSPRDAIILAGLTLMWVAFSLSLKRLEKIVFFLIPASFVCYQFYVLDINRDTPNIGVVWFLVVIGWATLTGRKTPVVLWGGVAMVAVILTCYRAPPDDPLWSHPLSLANILGVVCTVTVTCLWLQWGRQKRENALSNSLEETDRLSRELQKANARLRLSEARKSNLLSTMSHELRTPMMTIAAVAHDLSKRLNDAEDQVVVRTLLRSAENMTDLMGDVLDLEGVRSGLVAVVDQNFDVLDVVEDACNLALESTGHALVVIDIPPGLPVRFSGDPARLKQIMLNLLRNALRHSRSCEVALRLQSYSNNMLRFSVVDTGIGMSHEQAEHIFEPFVQMEGNGGGSGLGLPISRAFAELMGGNITVKSTLGVGTCFDVEVKVSAITTECFGDIITRPQCEKADVSGLYDLSRTALQRWLSYWNISEGEGGQHIELANAMSYPVSIKTFFADAGAERNEEAKESGEEHFDGIKLAIIEDDQVLRDLLARFFVGVKCEVYSAGDAIKGKNILDCQSPEVVIMDLNIPRAKDGLSLMHMAAELTHKPLVVVLSGQPEKMQMCLNAGADLFLVKPVRMSTLQHSIATHLSERVK